MERLVVGDTLQRVRLIGRVWQCLALSERAAGDVRGELSRRFLSPQSAQGAGLNVSR